jgi:alpha-ribazole phosphatase
MTRLLLVRHGATEYNHSLRFTGHSQIGLSDLGQRQVARLAGRLAAEDIDISLTSDLRRAVDTADAACQGREIDPATCPELREIDYGDCEGLTFDEIRVKYPEVVQPWLAYSPDLVFPTGESLAGFIERVGSFASRLAAHPEWKTALVVTHGGVIRVLICHLLGLESGHWWRFRIDNASLSIIETYGEKAILSLCNDTCHLAGVDEDG